MWKACKDFRPGTEEQTFWSYSLLQMMLKLLSLGLVAASKRVLLGENDPLAKELSNWSSEVLNLCESIAFEGDFRSKDYAWPRADAGCIDDASVALCFLARRLSGFSDCSDAANNYKMCLAFPDAMTNYCCETASDLPGCSGVNRTISAGVTGSQTGIVSSEKEDADVEAQSARPFLPEPSRRRLTPDSSKFGSKNLLILFPDKLSVCNIVNSVWRVSKMASVLLDLDMLGGMMEDSDLVTNHNRWLKNKISQRVQDMIDHGGYQQLNNILDGSAPLPEKKQLTIPSNSLRGVDEPKRFIDQFGASRPFHPPEDASQYTTAKPRSLRDCASLPDLIAETAGAAADWFSGALESGEFTQQLRVLLDDYLEVIDGQIAGVTRDSLQNIRGLGISTTSFALLPACSSLELSSFQLKNATPDPVEMSRSLLQATMKVRDAVFACDNCLEKLWVEIVRASSPTGEINEAAAAEEGARLRRGLSHFNSQMEEYLLTMTPETAPTSIGHVAELALNLLAEAVEEAGSDMGSAVEAGLLFLEALQNESTGGGIIQDSVKQFAEEYLDCPFLSSRNRNSGRRLATIETETAVAAVEAAARAMQQKKRHQLPYEAVGIATDHRSPPETSNIPPVGRHGNLNSREEATAVPIVGYQCRDSLPSLYKDYLSLWVERGNCSDLIETFGCFAQRGQYGDLLPFPILMHACPESWQSLCRQRTTPSRLMSEIRSLAVGDLDSGPDVLDDAFLAQVSEDFDAEEDDEQLHVFFSQIPQYGAFRPFQKCLGSTARRAGEDDTGMEAQQVRSPAGENDIPDLTVDTSTLPPESTHAITNSIPATLPDSTPKPSKKSLAVPGTSAGAWVFLVLFILVA
eukprot:Gregarina_sp_Poly_1__1706@NODE_143_length_12919_cov_90_642857_g128_i0_p2_GENE_NODE_143_length_12919_cov_90_642857_g128_i0NODE_143_length_12919_cov_90_642857_g128_i0_p2_ORF_typecomplete_len859_score153_19Sde2_N_Ubi/PF13019_6/0_3_NODE_143_length_12919_cov_90_642857_g128_i024054981